MMQETKQARLDDQAHSKALRGGELPIQQENSLVDNRAVAVRQHKLADAMTFGPRMTAQRTTVNMINQSPRAKAFSAQVGAVRRATVQRQAMRGEEDVLQDSFKPVQHLATDEDVPVQGKSESGLHLGSDESRLTQGKLTASNEALQRQEARPRPNTTGLPDTLKTGIESLSGISMDDVKVHYNSSQPAQLNAHAFAQGRDIHLASGQEKHLPHEAWHVVQQAQGRVKPTMQLKDAVPVNDDQELEQEANAMGARALMCAAPSISQPQERERLQIGTVATAAQSRAVNASGPRFGVPILQAVWIDNSGVVLQGDLLRQALARPLDALVDLGQKLGFGEDTTSLNYRLAAVQEWGPSNQLHQIANWLLETLQSKGSYTVDMLLAFVLQHLVLPDESMVDDYHEEDDTAGNKEEELDAGDLVLSEIESSQQIQIAFALARRHPELYKNFESLAAGYGKTATPEFFLNWFNAGPQTRSQFSAQFKTAQLARTPGSFSYQVLYQTSSHGVFKDITYRLDGLGSIDFGNVHRRRVWANPISGGSKVQLNDGAACKTHGLTLNGTKIKIAGASRGQHFSIANRIMNNGFSSRSPDGWTWHHLTDKYKMVLVDRMVHAKHGHNGGVYVWT